MTMMRNVTGFLNKIGSDSEKEKESEITLGLVDKEEGEENDDNNVFDEKPVSVEEFSMDSEEERQFQQTEAAFKRMHRVKTLGMALDGDGDLIKFGGD